MKLLKLPEVIKKTGLSRSSINYMALNDKFPKPLKTGERAVAWIEDEIDQWIQGLKRVGE